MVLILKKKKNSDVLKIWLDANYSARLDKQATVHVDQPLKATKWVGWVHIYHQSSGANIRCRLFGRHTDIANQTKEQGPFF